MTFKKFIKFDLFFIYFQQGIIFTIGKNKSRKTVAETVSDVITVKAE